MTHSKALITKFTIKVSAALAKDPTMTKDPATLQVLGCKTNVPIELLQVLIGVEISSKLASCHPALMTTQEGFRLLQQAVGYDPTALVAQGFSAEDLTQKLKDIQTAIKTSLVATIMRVNQAEVACTKFTESFDRDAFNNALSSWNVEYLSQVLNPSNELTEEMVTNLFGLGSRLGPSAEDIKLACELLPSLKTSMDCSSDDIREMVDMGETIKRILTTSGILVGELSLTQALIFPSSGKEMHEQIADGRENIKSTFDVDVSAFNVTLQDKLGAFGKEAKKRRQPAAKASLDASSSFAPLPEEGGEPKKRIRTKKPLEMEG